MKSLTNINPFSKAWRYLLASLLLVPGAALAQDTNESENLEEVEGFTVTGSRIRQLDLQPLNPVIVYDSDYLKKSGARDLQDIIDELPQNQLGLSDRYVFGTNPIGTAGANLRGAGAEYTLTLLNGRRAAPYGSGGVNQFSYFNINALPLAAIDRIEILTDGASAIYGADAVTGVINYILKTDYEGMQVSGAYQNTFDSDTSYVNVNAVVGNVSDKSSSMFIVDYATRNSLYARDRDFSRSSDQSPRGGLDWPTVGFPFPPYGAPSVIQDVNTGLYYVGSPESYNTEELLNNRALQDGQGNYKSFSELRDEFGKVITQPTDFMQLSPSYWRLSFFGTADYQLSEEMKVYMEASFTRNEYQNEVHPVALSSLDDFFDDSGTFFTVSEFNPYNPLGVNRTDGGTPTDVNIYYRNFDIGNRRNELTNDVLRIVAGVEGTFLDDFTYNVSGLFTTDYSSVVGTGYTLRSSTIDALTTTDGTLMDPDTTWNVFGKFTGGPLGGDDNNSQVTPGLSATTFTQFESKLYMANLDVSGPVFEAETGLIQFAAGAEIRELERYEIGDTASGNRDLIGTGGTDDSTGWRQVKSLYLEFSVPFYERVELQLAGRYEQFSGETGDNFSPKIAARVDPLEWMFIRGSYSEGFRAPSLQELFQGEVTAFGDAGPDPFRDDEPISSVRVVEGGNPLLEPEESESINFGIGIEPPMIEGLYLGIDWFSIDIDNRIESDTLAEIVESNDFRVVRAPQTPQDIADGISGRVIEIRNFTRNKAVMELESLDITIRYTINSDTLGEFQVRAVGSYLYSRKTKNDPADDFVENAGTNLEPEIRANVAASWSKGDWTVFGDVNYIGEYDQFWFPRLPASFGLTKPNVDEFITVDLGFTYSGFWGIDLTVQVINLFDEEPPLADRQQQGYDELHSPFGRMFRVGFTKEF